MDLTAETKEAVSVRQVRLVHFCLEYDERFREGIFTVISPEVVRKKIFENLEL
jgi:hypothetical protein